MSIVIELQKDSICKDANCISLLKKSYLVARKLELREFQEWTEQELKGYKDKNIIPEYRHIYGELEILDLNLHKWNSILFPNNEKEKEFCECWIHDSIPSLNSLLDKNTNNLIRPISANVTAQLNSQLNVMTKYRLYICPNSISDIVEQVCNKILEWAIILEENNILGENLSFTLEEKKKAQNQPQIINYISNFYGEVVDSQFQQGTKKSEQNMY